MSELQKIVCHPSHRKRASMLVSRQHRLVFSVGLAVFLALSGCRTEGTDAETDLANRRASNTGASISESPPGWSTEAIWYQIFVERFRNGDSSNDPRVEDIQGSDPLEYPADWQPMRWTQDWYERAEWEKNTGRDFYFTAQLRRYGGDLQGVLDRLDYLEDLGVTAVYFNPLNDAPSLHKYDARNYRHVDRNFGPDPDGDARIIADEDPADPTTWQWTSADSLFLALVEAMHSRGIRVIVDYSWNHTGLMFWAWRDLVELQDDSEYADWYRIERFDDPSTDENEFSYRGWAGVRTLPELLKTGVPDDYDGGPVEGDLNEGAKNHILAVTRRW
ncbi:MAG: hypothetical protein KJO98_05840, partial [Rhodothermia bacterium]|nr:hypothetical protein [Rhodothermia bacterium]